MPCPSLPPSRSKPKNDCLEVELHSKFELELELAVELMLVLDLELRLSLDLVLELEMDVECERRWRLYRITQIPDLQTWG